jgi:hypothetical protein
MLEIHTETYGSFDRDNSKPANLVSNNFFPLISINCLRMEGNQEENFTQTYYKPSITSSVRTKASSSKNILHSLNDEAQVTKYLFGDKVYYINKGLVTDSLGKILLILTIKKEVLVEYDYLKRNTFHHTHARFSYDNFVLFISSEMSCNPLHSVFYRRIQKNYLSFCYEKGMEVRTVPSSVIEKNTFANSLNLRFNSITELDYHLRNEVKYFLNADEGESVTRALQINIPPVDMEEDVEVLNEASNVSNVEAVQERILELQDLATASVGVPASYLNDSTDSVTSGYISGIDYYNNQVTTSSSISTDSIMAMSMAMNTAVRTPTVEPVVVDDDIIEF